MDSEEQLLEATAVLHAELCWPPGESAGANLPQLQADLSPAGFWRSSPSGARPATPAANLTLIGWPTAA